MKILTAPLRVSRSGAVNGQGIFVYIFMGNLAVNFLKRRLLGEYYGTGVSNILHQDICRFSHPEMLQRE